MAPSAGNGKSPPHHISSSEMNESYGWNQQNGKENQRPPVYDPENYVISLKKYSKFGSNNASIQSIYDTSEDNKTDNKTVDLIRSQTLPSSSKHSEYKSPTISPPDTDCEMTLRQFGSITDLLTKLRADLRASYPSFVQEFITSPMDGVSLLLEVLRAIQLSQNSITGSSTLNSQNIDLRNNQSYQRRALLDELTLLQCLSICGSRSPEAAARLGSTPVGLLGLACSATGTGIRARILALQLLTIACDRSIIAENSPKAVAQGHNAVSESLSTLRLRCAEPVRFRLLVGMMNSGGGSGELQAIGLRFINTFMESAENAQNRLYLQAELYQAGMEPQQMSKLISSTSPWLEKLLSEIKRFDSIRIDIDELQKQVRSSEQVRNKLVILERKVDALHEEKLVFTSIERRLQEKCAELQRELLQLKKKQKQKQQGENNSDMSTLEKRPVALPRQNAPNEKKKDPSENEDEGISSSETGPSMSPEPPKDANGTFNIEDDAESTTTIDDVIEELKNIVDDAEREIVEKQRLKNRSRSEDLIEPPPKEYEIVPVNLLPQPPKKSSKSLINVFAPTSVEGSDYDISFIQNNTKNNSLFEEDEELAIMASRHQANKTYETESKNHPDLVHTTCHRYLQHHKHQQPNLRPSKDENRAILNVIMDAREKEQRSLLMMNRAHSLERDIFPPQHFNGVFFMADMNSPKFPKPDITAALEAKRVTKNLDRMGSSYGLDSMIDIVMTSEPKIQQKSSQKSGNNNFNFKNSLVNAGLYSGQYLAKENSRAQSNVGSKVTDLLSGLY